MCILYSIDSIMSEVPYNEHTMKLNSHSDVNRGTYCSHNHFMLVLAVNYSYAMEMHFVRSLTFALSIVGLPMPELPSMYNVDIFMGKCPLYNHITHIQSQKDQQLSVVCMH
ncbi:hypothetical protein GDO78_000327 [Eleutherodactylus coqui]|uniref:Uncharacterized protein n=1 Tax=Eleutherodactylus coqui TaxID=57060 RepID=A0A8J6FPQ9_ELECQ|nr:hypothetical protein GDO78_000327 [Eleutherodactylus coqui]